MRLPPTSVMRKILIGILALLGIYELVALTDIDSGDTISVSTRVLFHTNTFWGRVTWFVVWGTFSAWFAYHIAKWHVEDPAN